MALHANNITMFQEFSMCQAPSQAFYMQYLIWSSQQLCEVG